MTQYSLHWLSFVNTITDVTAPCGSCIVVFLVPPITLFSFLFLFTFLLLHFPSVCLFYMNAMFLFYQLFCHLHTGLFVPFCLSACYAYLSFSLLPALVFSCRLIPLFLSVSHSSVLKVNVCDWLSFSSRLSAYEKESWVLAIRNALPLTVRLIVLLCLTGMQIFTHTLTHTRMRKKRDWVITRKEDLMSVSKGRELRGKPLTIRKSWLFSKGKLKVADN